MSVDLKVPEIRFQGFSGEWVEKKLIDLTENGFSNGVFNDPQKVGKGYRLINVKDMYSGDCIDVDSLSLIGIDEKEFKNNKVEYGDIFFTRSSLVKECIAYSNVNLSCRNDLTFDGHLIRMEPCKTTTDPVFLAYLFKSSSARRQLILGGKTTTMTTIGQSDIAIVELALPCDKPEQTQIGNTFQKLDSLINQHQQKHDKLSSIKKAMLERMFPKQGETIPEIRFKGFSDEWVEKSLADLTDYSNGKGHEDKQKTSGKYELINLNSISISGGLKPSGKFIDEADVTLKENDLVMVLSDIGHGDLLGRVALIPKSNIYVLNQRVALLRPNGDISPLFLLYNINAHQLYFKKQGAGMSQLNISRGVVESFSSFIPEKNEQTQIGNYFQKLDTLISQHQQQITKLNNIKQACLCKMFV
jgi:type I restriction enzyme S subunit